MTPTALHSPLFIVNFKAYIWGTRAVEFARKIGQIAEKSSAYLCVIPQIVDIPSITKASKVPVFSPHLDSLPPGRGTGRILPEAVRDAGAVGVLLNHAEHRIPLQELSQTLRRTHDVGLLSMVGAGTPNEAEAIAALQPDAILSEPPGRIGTLDSVGRDTEFVTQSIKRVKHIDPTIRVICGAGVASARDVKALVRLGVDGTGASRGIFDAKEPLTVLTEMVKALEGAWESETKKRPPLEPRR